MKRWGQEGDSENTATGSNRQGGPRSKTPDDLMIQHCGSKPAIVFVRTGKA